MAQKKHTEDVAKEDEWNNVSKYTTQGSNQGFADVFANGHRDYHLFIDYLHKSPTLHQNGILEPVDDETIDLLLDKHGLLAQFFQDRQHSFRDGWVSMGRRNHLHDRNVVRGVDLAS